MVDFHIQRFSDDTTIAGCVTEGIERGHYELWRLVRSLLSLHPDQRNNSDRLLQENTTVNIQGFDIEIEGTYKYLGVTINWIIQIPFT